MRSNIFSIEFNEIGRIVESILNITVSHCILIPPSVKRLMKVISYLNLIEEFQCLKPNFLY